VHLRPMLARPGELPSGDGWAYELKLDGFRACVSTLDGLRVYSRRGRSMTLQSARVQRGVAALEASTTFSLPRKSVAAPHPRLLRRRTGRLDGGFAFWLTQ
jgi:hypothetical protein